MDVSSPIQVYTDWVLSRETAFLIKVQRVLGLT